MGANSYAPQNAANNQARQWKPDPRFQPKFPRCVNGSNWRWVLPEPEVEVIARRADRLYREAPLSNIERAELLGQYSQLAHMSRHFYENRERRIKRWYAEEYFPRATAYVARLEAKYFGRVASAIESAGDNDDI